MFDDIIVSDLVWDILLDLYVAQAEGRLIDVSSLCASRTVSVSTALRKVWRLQAIGIIRRIPAVTDARRDYVALEAFAVARIEKFLATV